MPTQVQLALVTALGHGISVFQQRRNELVHQVRVRTAVAAALDERQVLSVVNFCRQSELLNRLGQSSARNQGTSTFSGISGSGFFAV